jgi:hypothetical protein
MLLYRWPGGSRCERALARLICKFRPAGLTGRPRAVDSASALIIVAAALVASHTAYAHGIAGNRLFPGTLSFDDPAVADEATLPNFSSLNHPADGGNVTDNRINWSFSRLLTPTVAFVVDNSWIRRDWDVSQRSGFDVTNLGVKWEVYRSNLHETLVAASLTWGIGHSGAQGVGANVPNMIKPGIFFGQGFGDLPESLTWLRPFGISGAVVLEHPTGGISTNLGIDPLTGQLGPMLTQHIDVLRWGFAIEYNMLYLTKRIGNELPKQEPLNQFVPLVEFAFDCASGKQTIATMNPGLSYVATTWQIAVEAIVPLNRESGHGIGARTQLLLFLDDLAPTLFGKPLLRR